MYHFNKSLLGGSYAAPSEPANRNNYNIASRTQTRSYASPAGAGAASPWDGSRSSHHAALSPSLRTAAYRYATSTSSSTKKSTISWSGTGLFSSPGKPGKEPGHLATRPPIKRTVTMPDDKRFGSAPDIRRTGSGGLLMRKRTFEEQEEVSRARAQELSVVFEQSDNKDTALNKNANVKHKSTEFTGSPSLNMMSAKQAAQRYAAKEVAAKKNVAEHKDPLLTPSKMKEKEKLEEQNRRKHELKKESRARGDTSTVAPRTPVEKLELAQTGQLRSATATARGHKSGVVTQGMTRATDDDGNPLYSSGLFAKRTHYERTELSRLKAAHMALEAEMSGSYSFELNKGGMKVLPKATEVTASPSIGTIGAQEAANRFSAVHGAQQQQKVKQRQPENNRKSDSPCRSVTRSGSRENQSPRCITSTPTSGRSKKETPVYDLPTLC